MLYLNHIAQLGNMEMFCFREKAAECSRSGIVGPVIRFFFPFFFLCFVGLAFSVFIIYIGYNYASVAQGM